MLIPRRLKTALRPAKVFLWDRDLLRTSSVLYLIFSLPVAVFILVISPLVLVRTARLATARIGELSLEPEGYFAEKRLGRIPPRTFDIFYISQAISNPFLVEKWKRELLVLPIARYLDAWAEVLPGGQRHRIDVAIAGERVFMYAEFLDQPRHLQLNADDERRAKSILKEIGLDTGPAHFCFFNRDSAYLDTHLPGRDWSYHGYRDSSIHHYAAAAEQLASPQLLALRMGAVVSEPLKSNHPQVIDYAHRYRNDLLDVYLIEHAKFVVGAACGLGALCQALRKDLVTVNATPFMTRDGFPGRRDIFIPKLYRNVATGRLLTFAEILDSPSRDFYLQKEFDDAGIEVVENSHDEILMAARQMEQVVQGSWAPSQDDERRQTAFKAILARRGLPKTRMPRIADGFLQKYESLLS